MIINFLEITQIQPHPVWANNDMGLTSTNQILQLFSSFTVTLILRLLCNFDEKLEC